MTKSKVYKYTQCTSMYIKGLFFLEFELEGIDCGSHLCIQIETVPETDVPVEFKRVEVASSFESVSDTSPSSRR